MEARTLALNHDADAVLCSEDNGDTFGACASKTTHIFPVEAYRSNTAQVIRFIRTDGVRSFSEDYTYYPQPEDLPLVTFIPCDHAFKAGDSLDLLTKLFASAADHNKDNKVAVCFEQGLTINTATNFNIAVDRLWLIGHSANRPTLVNTNEGSSIAPCGDNRNRLILAPGKSFALVNIALQTKGCRGSVLEIIGTQSMDFLIENSSLSAFGSEGDAMSVLSTKGTTSGRITHSHLLALGGEQKNFYPN